MTVSFRFVLALAAVILFVIAALVAFGAASAGNALGLAFIGLACLALAHIVP